MRRALMATAGIGMTVWLTACGDAAPSGGDAAEERTGRAASGVTTGADAGLMCFFCEEQTGGGGGGGGGTTPLEPSWEGGWNGTAGEEGDFDEVTVRGTKGPLKPPVILTPVPWHDLPVERDRGGGGGDGPDFIEKRINRCPVVGLPCTQLCSSIGAGCPPTQVHPFTSGLPIGQLMGCRSGWPTYTCTYVYPNTDQCTETMPVRWPFLCEKFMP